MAEEKGVVFCVLLDEKRAAELPGSITDKVCAHCKRGVMMTPETFKRLEGVDFVCACIDCAMRLKLFSKVKEVVPPTEGQIRELAKLLKIDEEKPN